MMPRHGFTLVAIAVFATACRETPVDRDEVRVASVVAESLTAEFTDLVAGGPPGGRVQLAENEVVSACFDRELGTRPQTHSTRTFIIVLPRGFVRQAAPRGSRDSTDAEWKASDGSWVRVSKGGGRHSGSVGGGRTECDTFVNGAAVHVDAGDWGYGSTSGFMTTAYFDFGPMAPSTTTPSFPGGRTRALPAEARKPGLQFQAFARSRERHAELLKAMRSIAILPTWGSE